MGIPSVNERAFAFPPLFPSQLLVQLGHVVVPLRLVAGPRHGRSQLVLLPKALDPELATAVPGAVGQHGLGARQRPRLLVHQPHVPVEACGERRGREARSGGKNLCLFTCAFGRTRTHIIGHGAAG